MFWASERQGESPATEKTDRSPSTGLFSYYDKRIEKFKAHVQSSRNPR